MNPNEEHPQSISPFETELGFRLQPIVGLAGGALQKSQEQLVVALRLSSSEILLKAYDLDRRIRYYHKKYGYDILPGGHETPYSWNPVSGPWEDPKEFLEMYRKGIKTMFERMAGQIHGVPYPFQTV